MPVATTTRSVVQAHVGLAQLQADPAYLQKDFATLIESMALASGVKLVGEDQPLPTGLQVAP